MNFKELLQKFKFTEYEIIIYEFILQNDSKYISAKEIIKASNIIPSTVYRILDGFVENGFCSVKSEYMGVRCYKALINDQLKPFFLINDKTILPETEFFFGFEDMKKLYENTIRGEDIFAFANIDNLNKNILDFVTNEYVPKRAKSKVKAYVIASPFSFAKDYAIEGEKYLRYTKMCDKFFDYGEMNIYGDKVVILGARPGEHVGVSIKNAFLAKAMKSMFDLSWDLIKT